MLPLECNLVIATNSKKILDFFLAITIVIDKYLRFVPSLTNRVAIDEKFQNRLK